MRIRSIKPEFYRSEDIAALDWDARLLFIGLWSYVDDNGVGRDVEQLIAADLFALDRDPLDSLARVSRGLASLSDQGLIVRYTVEKKRFLAVTGWERHQRIDKPNAPRYPGPDQGFPSESGGAREGVAKDSRLEQRNRGTEEQGNRGDTPLLAPAGPSAVEKAAGVEKLFQEFYDTYPRHVGRQAAEKAFRKAIEGRGVTAEMVIAGVRRFAADPHLPEKQYIPHPASWLNAGRWDDEPLPPRGGGRAQEKQQHSIDLVRGYQQREEQEHEEVGAGTRPRLGLVR